jgi:hypothetical protein
MNAAEERKPSRIEDILQSLEDAVGGIRGLQRVSSELCDLVIGPQPTPEAVEKTEELPDCILESLERYCEKIHVAIERTQESLGKIEGQIGTELFSRPRCD